jgi:hypothetical protein
MIHVLRTLHVQSMCRGESEPSGAALLELGSRLLDFWLNICVCNSLIVEKSSAEGAPPVYQVSTSGAANVLVQALLVLGAGLFG